MFVDPYGESWAGFWGGVGMIVGGAALAVGTVVEDFATGGVGILDDGVSFVVAAELIEGGMAVIAADRASEAVVDIIQERRGERNQEKGRGDDPYWDKSEEELRNIEKKQEAKNKRKERKELENKNKRKGKVMENVENNW